MSTQCLLERPAVLARLRARRAILRPPPRMNLSDWADAFRVVPRKTSATPGRWRSNLQPVGIGIVNAVSHPEVTTGPGRPRAAPQTPNPALAKCAAERMTDRGDVMSTPS